MPFLKKSLFLDPCRFGRMMVRCPGDSFRLTHNLAYLVRRHTSFYGARFGPRVRFQRVNQSQDEDRHEKRGAEKN